MGTAIYMSPEQIHETRSVTPRSDIYSLGVVLWQMVTGQKPYSTETLSAFQLQLKIVNEPLPLTRTNWDNLIQKATEKDSQHRYADISAFHSAWQKGQNVLKERRDSGDKTVIEHKTEKPVTKTAQEPTKLPGKVVLFVLSLLLLISLGAGYFIWKGNNDKIIGDYVKIGNQEWQIKNLDVDRFRNGDPIPHARTAEEWKSAGEKGEPAWCYYDDDAENGELYGKLYNWYAVNDPRGLAPEGWHLPTDNEWTVLTDYLGGKDMAGGKMKSTETAFWISPNTGATNESGFSALPGGLRYFDGSFSGIKDFAFFWSAAENKENSSWNRYLYNSNRSVLRIYNFLDDKSVGASVRCLRD
jgi:uncharacterized protein (TIGR02145 family)